MKITGAGLDIVRRVHSMLLTNRSKAIDIVYDEIDTALLRGDLVSAKLMIDAIDASDLPTSIKLSAWIVARPWRDMMRFV